MSGVGVGGVEEHATRKVARTKIAPTNNRRQAAPSKLPFVRTESKLLEAAALGGTKNFIRRTVSIILFSVIKP